MTGDADADWICSNFTKLCWDLGESGSRLLNFRWGLNITMTRLTPCALACCRTQKADLDQSSNDPMVLLLLQLECSVVRSSS